MYYLLINVSISISHKKNGNGTPPRVVLPLVQECTTARRFLPIPRREATHIRTQLLPLANPIVVDLGGNTTL